MIKKVRKRDGRIVDFDFNKIIEAVKKAFESQNETYDNDIEGHGQILLFQSVIKSLVLRKYKTP